MKRFELWPALWRHEERDFLLALTGSMAFYALLLLFIHTMPIPERSHEDFRQMPRHIAKLILEAPKTPPKPQAQPSGQPAPSIPKGEENPAEKAQAEKEARKPSIQEAAPPPRQEARLTREAEARERLRRNREIAMQSGLLRLLTQDKKAGAKDPARDERLKKVLAPAAALNRLEEPAPDPASQTRIIRGDGSGGIDKLIAALKEQGQAANGGGFIGGIGDRRVARVESPFEVLGAGGREATRSYESIREAVEALTGWIRFAYNRSLRRNPALRGTITLEFNILPSGEVSDCRVASSTLNDPELEHQLVRRFLQLRFPPVTGGINTVVYPINLVPSG